MQIAHTHSPRQELRPVYAVIRADALIGDDQVPARSIVAVKDAILLTNGNVRRSGPRIVFRPPPGGSQATPPRFQDGLSGGVCAFVRNSRLLQPA